MTTSLSNGAESAAGELKRRLDARGGSIRLRRVDVAELSIERRRNGRGFIYVRNGRRVADERLLYRLKRLAVPPAYEGVRYAESPNAHIQAIGRDAAGRVQYRYHPDWDKLREQRKARRLRELLRSLPKIRRAIGRHLRARELTREFALAAVIDLIALTALRPGSEVYAREHGTRGAATLLKSDVTLRGDTIALKFRGKGGKLIEREVRSRRLARAIKRLQALPGKRLFQYRSADGAIAVARRRDANDFLHEIASADIALKDFRTLTACARALENLVKLEPKPSDAGRRRQLKECFCAVSEELANTPAICRKSYVHAVVVQSFESGSLQALAKHKAAGGEAMLRVLLADAGR
ncbi:MAG: DNA topoisomerase IB [Proteobacteria bacterium]|nr:DNA topoisomerase IB [Pseudomonadota bacterium]